MAVSFDQTRIQRLIGIARWVAAIVVVIWLAKVIADSLLLWYAGPQEVAPPDPSLQRLTVVERQSNGSLSRQQVEGWNLFGVPPEEAPEERVVDAPDTRLRLELLGLFQHRDQSQARAIIAEQGRDAALLKPGDRVPGNAELVEVLADRVILRRQGQLEALRLREPELSGGGVSATPPVRQQPANRRPGGAPSAPSPQADTELNLFEGDAAQQRRMIIEQLGLAPVTEGSAEGYRITEAAPADVISSVGLRPGDQIMSVNGHPLGDEAGDVRAIEEALASGSASIEVQRGSRRFTVNYPP
ncbi:type II secretion system protein N [Isoalcanivorax indicus]|uniref:type II secretion system protein N n=1 Tax=Isoalcanivorax indicus TaxID=2202653 RepID=UPI000DBA158E|nr:type II secretion system protein N [Isoalcanivorax indicus]